MEAAAAKFSHDADILQQAKGGFEGFNVPLAILKAPKKETKAKAGKARSGCTVKLILTFQELTKALHSLLNDPAMKGSCLQKYQKTVSNRPTYARMEWKRVMVPQTKEDGGAAAKWKVEVRKSKATSWEGVYTGYARPTPILRTYGALLTP